MVAWDKAKGKQGGGSGDGDRREIVRLKLENGDTKVRLVGDVLPRYVRWVVTNEGKKFPVEALNFDRATEEWNNSLPDPMSEVPEEVFSDKPQFAYVCNIINRGSTQVELFDIKATIYKEVVNYAVDPDYGNPADENEGYDITVTREKTGPLPQNVKYSVRPGRASSPLTDEEKAMELYDLDKIFKRQTYDEQKQWLLKNTAYFLDDAGNEAQPESAEDLD